MSATNVLLRKNEDTPTLDVYKRKGGAFTAPRSPKQTELEKAYGMNPDGTLKASAGTTPATAEKVPATVEKAPAPSVAQEAYDSGMAELERAYGEGVKQQDRLRADSRRDATAVYERMSRYLPRAQMAMGTAGTGMAESDRIAAYNNYTGQLAAANRTHADNVAALGEAKASGEAKLKRELITGQQTEREDADNLTLDVYKQMATDAMADGKLTEAELASLNEYASVNPMQTANGQSTMAQLQQMYGAKVTKDGELTEAEKATNSGNLLQEFFGKYGLMVDANDKISQANYNELQAWYREHERELTLLDKQSVQRQLNDLASYVYTDEEQAKSDREVQIEKDGGAVRAGVNFDSGFVGSDGKIYVQFVDSQGNIYTVPQMMKCKDEQVVALADSIAETDEVFMYDNELYVKRADGNTYKLGGKSGYGAKEQVHYNQLVTYFRRYAGGKA